MTSKALIGSNSGWLDGRVATYPCLKSERPIPSRDWHVEPARKSATQAGSYVVPPVSSPPPRLSTSAPEVALLEAVPEAETASIRAGLEGFESLAWTELLELLAGPAVARALRDAALFDLASAGVAVLAGEHGLAPALATRIAAAFELGRRVELARRPGRTRMDCAAEVQRRLQPKLRGADRESFFVLALDGKHALVREHCVSIGSLNSSLVHPREVFRPAIQVAAAAVICAHNHPSGDPEPSAEDLVVTRRLVECGKLVGIPLLDHVILGEGRYVSLRQRLAWS